MPTLDIHSQPTRLKILRQNLRHFRQPKSFLLQQKKKLPHFLTYHRTCHLKVRLHLLMATTAPVIVRAVHLVHDLDHVLPANALTLVAEHVAEVLINHVLLVDIDVVHILEVLQAGVSLEETEGGEVAIEVVEEEE